MKYHLNKILKNGPERKTWNEMYVFLPWLLHLLNTNLLGFQNIPDTVIGDHIRMKNTQKPWERRVS